jgi:hypothetical protein
VCDALALEIGEFLVGTVLFDDRNEMVAVRSLLGALRGERHGAGEVDREPGRAGREAGHMEAAGAHRFDLGRVRLYGVINHALAGALGEKVGEWLEYVLIDGRILDRRIGKNEC